MSRAVNDAAPTILVGSGLGAHPGPVLCSRVRLCRASLSGLRMRCFTAAILPWILDAIFTISAQLPSLNRDMGEFSAHSS